ncbi:MAG: HNH endonuclease [Solirubrobacterales bacterium]
MPPADPDHALRLAALEKARVLTNAFDDIVPLHVLREGFEFQGRRISFGSFYKGIHRAKEQIGPAALTLTTSAKGPYDDVLDPDARSIIYHYRAGSVDQPDNRALRSAFEIQAPLIYFLGIDPGQYQVVWPAFVTEDDPGSRMVLLEVGLPVRDTTGDGLQTPVDTRRYKLAQVARRYHQAQFRREVMRAYRDRCAVCSLREPELLEASHIVRDTEPAGIAAVVNGIALCAIHHLAYDRNLLGIDPGGEVHIGARLLAEEDGPMLGEGIQSFHGAAILCPRRPEDQPDPERLALRFGEFEQTAA